jgi:hypothetical protein
MTSVQTGLSSARLSTELNTVLSYALDAHQCGCSVIPLRGGKNQTSGKRPQVAWQTYQTSRVCSQQIHDWFDKGTSAYGVVCGQISRLIVIDFDDADAQAKFIQKFPYLMDTYIVKSGGRGTLHLYYEVDFPVRTTKIRGGDLKAEGSYVVGAGSHIAGGTWEVFRDMPLKRITQEELKDVMSVFGIVRPLSTSQPITQEIPHKVSPDYIKSLYHSFVQQFSSRNEALFRAGCMMRDEGYGIDMVTATLSQSHIQHPPVTRHNSETIFQRQKETTLTLRSVFKRPARPKSKTVAKSSQASYVPNHLREAILKQKHGTAFLRVYEGLKLVSKSAGEHVSEKNILTLLSPHGIGRRSIRNALSFSHNTNTHRQNDKAMGSKMVEEITNTCVFVPTTKRDKSPSHRPPQEYIIPTIGRLCKLFNVNGKGADPISLGDIQSVQVYRSALNQELIRRRTGKYSQTWLAKRLSVCVRTLQRYVRLAGIQCEQLLYMTEITARNVHQIPAKALAKRAGITIKHCFIQDAKGKRYPPLPAIATKLLEQHVPIYWVRRGCNIYWMGNQASYSHIIFVAEIEHQYTDVCGCLHPRRF